MKEIYCTFQVEGYHHRSVFQPINNLTFIFPIILQGDFCDDQRGVHRGGALEVDAAVETAITPFVVIHGNENIHLGNARLVLAGRLEIGSAKNNIL